MKNLTLITGGVRSGKSSLAEKIVREASVPAEPQAAPFSVFYLATMPAIAGDLEQEQRILRHRKRRPDEWITAECPYGLVTTIGNLPAGKALCLLDCLSLHVSNLMLAAGEADPYRVEDLIMGSADEVLRTMEKRKDLQFVVVTNEVGWGVVPDSPLGRAFRDFLGIVNQKFATAADTVWLSCSGIPLRIKPQ